MSKIWAQAEAKFIPFWHFVYLEQMNCLQEKEGAVYFSCNPLEPSLTKKKKKTNANSME